MALTQLGVEESIAYQVKKYLEMLHKHSNFKDMDRDTCEEHLKKKFNERGFSKEICFILRPSSIEGCYVLSYLPYFEDPITPEKVIHRLFKITANGKMLDKENDDSEAESWSCCVTLDDHIQADFDYSMRPQAIPLEVSNFLKRIDPSNSTNPSSWKANSEWLGFGSLGHMTRNRASPAGLELRKEFERRMPYLCLQLETMAGLLFFNEQFVSDFKKSTHAMNKTENDIRDPGAFCRMNFSLYCRIIDIRERYQHYFMEYVKKFVSEHTVPGVSNMIMGYYFDPSHKDDQHYCFENTRGLELAANDPRIPEHSCEKSCKVLFEYYNNLPDSPENISRVNSLKTFTVQYNKLINSVMDEYTKAKNPPVNKTQLKDSEIILNDNKDDSSTDIVKKI